MYDVKKLPKRKWNQNHSAAECHEKWDPEKPSYGLCQAGSNGVIGKKNPISKEQELSTVMQRYTPEEIERAVMKANGITSVICAILDCTVSQWMSYVAKRPETRAIVEQARQAIVDKAEKVLLRELDSPNSEIALKAAKYVLDRLGQRRGWAPTPLIATQVTCSDGEKVKMVQTIFGINPDEQ